MLHKACHLPLAMSSVIIHAKGRNVKLRFTYKQHHSLIFVKSRLTSSLCRQKKAAFLRRPTLRVFLSDCSRYLDDSSEDPHPFHVFPGEDLRTIQGGIVGPDDDSILCLGQALDLQ